MLIIKITANVTLAVIIMIKILASSQMYRLPYIHVQSRCCFFSSSENHVSVGNQECFRILNKILPVFGLGQPC